MSRSKDGHETWRRLLDWTKGQAPSERLAGHILRSDGYASVDPSHPLGGKDGLKDSVCLKGTAKWIGAAFFPRGQKSLKEIKKKFKDDLKGVKANGADGIAFVTNQELRLSERNDLIALAEADGVEADIFHLERTAQILDMPPNYGVRFEFLDIEMSKEEQVSFFATHELVLTELRDTVNKIYSGSISADSQDGKDIPVVFPQDLGAQSHLSASIYPPKVQECSDCKGVFMISTAPNYASSYTSYGMRTFTCPYCGRTERYTGI